MTPVLVNVADWAAEGNPEVPEGWLIANAPRPLAGRVTWTGRWRHGVFYAAAPEVPGGHFGWEADDAWLVEWVDNEVIRARVLDRVRQGGYYQTLDAMEADGITVEDMARDMQLPWHEDKPLPPSGQVPAGRRAVTRRPGGRIWTARRWT